MSVNWRNPYADRSGRWLKGNLHSHCSPASPCGDISLADLLAGYSSNSYDFLCVSDHLAVTEAKSNGMLLCPGLEWNSRIGSMHNRAVTYQHHLGIYSQDPGQLNAALTARAPEELLPAMDSSTIIVANHPNWLIDEHWDYANLLRFSAHLDGLEIYNALMEVDDGEADCTGKWDRLLSSGHRLLGFASDDAHRPEDIGKAWLMVRSETADTDAVYRAIKTGNFYCSTGVVIEDTGRDGDTLFLTTNQEARISAMGAGGRKLAQTMGRELRIDLSKEDTPYIRFLAEDRNWSQAWTQPFFKTGAE